MMSENKKSQRVHTIFWRVHKCSRKSGGISTGVISRVLVASLVLLLTGCRTVEKFSLTYRLWDTSDLSKWSEPAPNPNPALFVTTNHSDVLVLYDALSEKHSTIKRQAYFFRQNESRLATGKKLKLVSLAEPDQFQAVTVLASSDNPTNLPPGNTTYAVVTKDGRQFRLHRPNEPELTIDLPTYAESSGTPLRVLMTPLAVAGDTVMVGAVGAVVGFIVWVQMGAPTP